MVLVPFHFYKTNLLGISAARSQAFQKCGNQMEQDAEDHPHISLKAKH